MTPMWWAILGGAVACYAAKLAGMSLPARWLDNERLGQIADLIPVALLAALIAVQTFTGAHGAPVLDARAGGLVAAIVAAALRAPFLVVVLAGVAVTALLRHLTGM